MKRKLALKLLSWCNVFELLSIIIQLWKLKTFFFSYQPTLFICFMTYKKKYYLWRVLGNSILDNMFL